MKGHVLRVGSEDRQIGQFVVAVVAVVVVDDVLWQQREIARD